MLKDRTLISEWSRTPEVVLGGAFEIGEPWKPTFTHEPISTERKISSEGKSERRPKGLLPGSGTGLGEAINRVSTVSCYSVACDTPQIEVINFAKKRMIFIDTDDLYARLSRPIRVKVTTESTILVS